MRAAVYLTHTHIQAETAILYKVAAMYAYSTADEHYRHTAAVIVHTSVA